MAEARVAERYDVAVLGGGIDGLVASARLARAGRRVVLLEASDRLGGTLATDEIAPGVRSPAVFASAETLAPEVVAELDLASHGFELAEPGGVFVATGDERSRFFPPPGASAIDTRALRTLADGGVSDADVAALEAFDAFLHRLAGALAPTLAEPLPRLDPSGLGGVLALLRPMLRLRKLGTEELAEIMRFLPMALQDVVEERFADQALRIAVAAGGLTSSWLGPRSPGGALNLMLHRSAIGRGAIGYPRFVLGGPGALADALTSAARSAGVELRVSVPLSAIETRFVATGPRVDGVLLADGERIEARAVLSTLDPATTFLGLIGGRILPPSLVEALGAVRSRGTVAVVTFVTQGEPTFRHAPDGADVLSGRVLVASSLGDIERAFDDTKYGRLPRKPFLDVTVPSAVDDRLTPEGDDHVVHAWVQYPPFALRAGDWAQAREPLGDVVEATLASVAPGFAEQVRSRRVLTPADLATRFGLPGGSVYQLEPALDQLLFMRPMPRWFRHETPIRGLYLGGPATHGGLGISGLAGRNAATVVLEL